METESKPRSSKPNLKIEARQRAEKFGHMMSQFIPYEGGLLGVCKRCKKQAKIKDGLLVIEAGGALTSVCG